MRSTAYLLCGQLARLGIDDGVIPLTPAIGLAAAREAAGQARALLKYGKDPIAAREAQREQEPTFDDGDPCEQKVSAQHVFRLPHTKGGNVPLRECLANLHAAPTFGNSIFLAEFARGPGATPAVMF